MLLLQVEVGRLPACVVPTEGHASWRWCVSSLSRLSMTGVERSQLESPGKHGFDANTHFYKKQANDRKAMRVSQETPPFGDILQLLVPACSGVKPQNLRINSQKGREYWTPNRLGFKLGLPLKKKNKNLGHLPKTTPPFCLWGHSGTLQPLLPHCCHRAAELHEADAAYPFGVLGKATKEQESDPIL